MVCGVWCVVCGVWCVVCGVWCVWCVWCVVCGVWCVVCVVCGVRCGVVCGCGMWYVVWCAGSSRHQAAVHGHGAGWVFASDHGHAAPPFPSLRQTLTRPSQSPAPRSPTRAWESPRTRAPESRSPCPSCCQGMPTTPSRWSSTSPLQCVAGLWGGGGLCERGVWGWMHGTAVGWFQKHQQLRPQVCRCPPSPPHTQTISDSFFDASVTINVDPTPTATATASVSPSQSSR